MILQWFQEKLIQRTQKSKHDIIKLEWQKAKLENLLANKDNMSPIEFKREYQKLI